MYTIELSKKALLHNIHTFRSQIGKGTEIMAIVKSNAYGHGIKEIARARELWLDFFIGENQYHQSDAHWHNYIGAYTQAAQFSRQNSTT